MSGRKFSDLKFINIICLRALKPLQINMTCQWLKVQPLQHQIFVVNFTISLFLVPFPELLEISPMPL